MTITERIFGILAQKGLSQKEFSRIIEVNEKTVSAWKKNNSLPPADKLPEISDCLGVSLDYLITGEKCTKQLLTENERELLEYFGKLNERQQMKLIFKAEDMLEDNK
ncbi:MAG: helix-turn-helix domain-containing protein [Ruminococcus sp.]|nr:helix-turn-helix domain-containing protein [Ruminococcus sp.]